MSTQVYIHPSLPALIRVYEKDFDFTTQYEAANLEDIAMLDAQTQKIYYVVDTSELVVSFENLLIGAHNAARTELGQRKYRNPNVIENIMVVRQRLVELAAQNLKAPALGAVEFKIFQTIEEALAYITQQQVSR
jgi:hypothetical protein